VRLSFQFRPACQQQQRIEVALHRHPGGKFPCRPERIDRFIQPQRIDPGLTRIGRELLARTSSTSATESASTLRSNMSNSCSRW
jgi:hypothetical protein